MKKCARLVALALILVMLLTACGQIPYVTAAASEKVMPMASVEKDNVSITEIVLQILFHEPLIEQGEIKVHYTKERKELIEKTEKALSETPVRVAVEGKGLFSKGHYAVTAYDEGAYYYGETKKNRPHGFGVLVSAPLDLENDLGTAAYLIYAGDWKKGVYSGYGAEFNHSPDADVQSVRMLVQDGCVDENLGELLEAYLHAYVTKDGKWKSGKLSGDVNYFYFNSYSLNLSYPYPDGYWADCCVPVTEVTHAKNDKRNGKIVSYEGTALVLEGTMKRDVLTGNLKTYYYNGQVKYKGKVKNNSYNGKGTLYDESGNVIYSGKWKNGNYAS